METSSSHLSASSSLQDEVATSREIPRVDTRRCLISRRLGWDDPGLTRRYVNRRFDSAAGSCPTTPAAAGKTAREERQLLIYWRLLRRREPDQRQPQSAVRATLEDHRRRKRRQNAPPQVRRGRNGSLLPFSLVACKRFRSFEDEIKTTGTRVPRGLS